MNTEIIVAIIAALAVAVPSILTTVITFKANETRQTMQIEEIFRQISKMENKLDKHNGFEGRIIRLEAILLDKKE